MSKEIKTTLPVKNNIGIVAARGVNDDSSLAQYIQNVQKIPVLTAEQEYEYATKWVQNRDKFAAEKLVASHLRMVVSVAYDYKNYGIPVGELIASFSLFATGSIYMILLLILFIIGVYAFIKREWPEFFSTKMLGFYLFAIGILTFMHWEFVSENLGKGCIFINSYKMLLKY